jgi:hypothetical protein
MIFQMSACEISSHFRPGLALIWPDSRHEKARTIMGSVHIRASAHPLAITGYPARVRSKAKYFCNVSQRLVLLHFYMHNFTVTVTGELYFLYI